MEAVPIRTMVITGARQEYERFICDCATEWVPPGEGFFLLPQRGADEALAHADRLMPLQEQYLICDLLRTKAQLLSHAGVKRCVLVSCVACRRDETGFEECKQFVRRELYEVDRWHLFDDITLACLTPEPEIIRLC